MLYNTIVNHKFFRSIKDVTLFIFLILSFHFFFRYWAYALQYWPLQNLINPIYEYLTELLFDNSIWTLEHLMPYEFTTKGRNIFMGSGYVGVHHGCSGLKQFLQWIVLMIFFYGPWKRKLWFIPCGLIIIHIVNIFRIAGLSILLNYYPQHWHFTHDYIFRPLFYIVMFGMWVVWVEWFSLKNK